NRDKLMFAKIMIEVAIDQSFPTLIHFYNEKGVKVDQKVNYEWLHITFTTCKGLGHTMENCTKQPTGKMKKIWVKKPIQKHTVIEPKKTQEPGEPSTSVDGFTQAIMLEGFHIFSTTTGLSVNPSKSSIYCCGMKEELVKEISQISGFGVGVLPFKYLGVPVSPWKLKAGDCDMVVDKMIARIKVWSSRHLSFAGRSQLVNSVLLSICVYWAQIFIFPKSVIKKINSICRSFLWHGSFDDSRPGAIAWDTVCQPKSQGGLGFRNLLLWNQAAVGKQAWAIANKQDNLWVRWIHSVYVKEKAWDQFTAPTAASWVVKKNCCSAHLQSTQWMHAPKYSIKGTYQLLRTQGETVKWQHWVWNRFSIP
ncbi:hypothetical protein SOVF_137540, partial [Spinacia oleracea]